MPFAEGFQLSVGGGGGGVVEMGQMGFGTKRGFKVGELMRGKEG